MMKVKFPCFDCRKEHKNGELIGEIDGVHDYVSCKCENGHSAKVFPQTPLYVYLLEHALDAYKNQMYFEAFLSAYSSLENLWRITAKAALWNSFRGAKGLDLVEKTSELSTYHQSERCLGLFLQTAIQFFGAAIQPYLKTLMQGNKSIVSVRNRIMHGSAMPSQNDTKQVIELLHHLRSFVELKMTYTPEMDAPKGIDSEQGILQTFSSLFVIEQQRKTPGFKKYAKAVFHRGSEIPMTNDLYNGPYSDTSLHMWHSSSMFKREMDREEELTKQLSMDIDDLLKERAKLIDLLNQ
ncbi:hypothetical protein LCA12A_0953 [Lacticaseibacillus casei 12A]|uniref:hypothetical protein n=1 Tax=Lacticaseibacillus paracasei TaxID=1597 RepID=UPI0002986F98|nr:hypothetical protein [Lacticaseibacillus paracasei]EKP98174.1 hypothetical protein LCA12A_0953 [Lacticaseibacillus casei 12A]